ncbi:MAG: YidC/Oxa1 family insertase periplasmic-domain containing protein [Gemmataceae bacterium]|nr:YidC/Oxa1 family insertase periplasmic-domain containing protein [Gemmata sp.]MDW8199132.1 YidC/Oxa1 family insertase periplasmic-domain containing protein [Gemmataceae bacterium]
MRNNLINIAIFMVLAAGLFVLWQQTEALLPPQKKEDDKAKVDDTAKKNDDSKKADPPQPVQLEPGPAPEDSDWASTAQRALVPAIRAGAQPGTPTLIPLGDETFYNQVMLTTRGGGVQQVVLPQFGQADRLGRAVMQTDVNGQPTPTPVPLYLIPGVVHPRGRYLREPYQPPILAPGPARETLPLAEPCFTLFHYPTPEDKYPDPLLGEINWRVVRQERPADGPHQVVFETELGEPYHWKITKTYTLAPKDYHIGLRIAIQRLPGGEKGKGALRYQISGPRGLPIEGEWYTSIYRVAIIGWKDNKEKLRRQYEDAASIGAKRGGEAVNRGDNSLKYMAVANQYFASAVCIDDQAKDHGAVEQPWAYVRATTELPFDQKQNPHAPYFDDITVRAASETIDLAPTDPPIVHSYLLYNGPAKVGLLKLLAYDPQRRVDETLVDRYKDSLTLSTITDFRSETWLGRFLSAIWWSDLVIACTNLMHLFLALIHYVIPDWALSIVVVTVFVRLLLFYPSRRQTVMSLRMMEIQKKLQPELEKLQAKYKDDLNTYNREKMRLMMAHGVNPFAMMGGCLLLLAQMPIMMGLYFCLQESVFFRLESFLWINNLAAPDMLIWWGEKIPYISTPEDIGSILYFGPYFNLLPVLAVGLMLYHQAKMMPPATDPQAEQQRMMMKIMMVMMAFFFYKVAAGLALYFIISTLWGLMERQFIPKPKISLDEPAGPSAPAATATKIVSPNGKPTAAEAVAAAQKKSKGLLTRLREALQQKMEELQRQADEQAKRQIRNAPPPSGPPGGPPGSGRDKKKKRRK